ncbi:antitoxin VbhA family protein [Isoptericola sp. NPDC055881]
MPISDEERAQRAADAARVRHSTELEGGRSSDAARAIQEAYVRGEIDADELVRRTKALHAITDQ